MPDPRTDRVAFSRQVLNVDPFDHEAEALRSEAPYVVIAGGRRSGKSETAQIAALHGLFTHPGGEWLVTSANEDNARRFVTEAADLARASQLAARAVSDEWALRLQLDNGASLLAVAPTPGKLRGPGRKIVGVTWEEAGFCPASTFRDGRYTLLDNREAGAQGWLIGSPWGGPDHFFRQSHGRGLDGDPDFASFQWSTAMNPRLPAGWIERERGRLAPSEAAAELDGVWSDAVGALFPRALLERQTADLEIPALGALRGPARPVASLDTGVSFDHSASVVIYRAPVDGLNEGRERRAVFVGFPYVWPQGTPLLEPARELAKARAPWLCLVPEANGVGAGPAQELRRLRRCGRMVPVSTSAPLKTAAYSAVLAMLEFGALVLPRHPDMLRQLAGMRFEQGQRGFMHIEAEDAAVHDDIADALALAMVPFRKGKTVHCFVPRMANLFPAEAHVPPLDEPVVETGAGLRVYRRPVLQSVRGLELTLPAGARYVDVDAERRRVEMEAMRDRVWSLIEEEEAVDAR